MGQESDDLALARKAGGGDDRAFADLADRHMPDLYRLAYSLLGNAADAEDAVQETLMGAYDGMGRFKGRSSIRTWLKRILLHQAVNVRRKRKRHRAESIDDVQAAVAAETDSTDGTMDVRAAMEQLSEEHRQVLVLREFEGMGYQEMADLLDVPRGTIESRLHRARSELREKLREYST